MIPPLPGFGREVRMSNAKIQLFYHSRAEFSQVFRIWWSSNYEVLDPPVRVWYFHTDYSQRVMDGFGVAILICAVGLAYIPGDLVFRTAQTESIMAAIPVIILWSM